MEKILQNTTTFLLSCLLFLLILNEVHLLEYLLNIIGLIKFLPLSLLLVFVFEPLIRSIKYSRFISSTIVYFSLLIFIFLFFILVIPILANEFKLIYEMLMKLIKSNELTLFELARNINIESTMNVAMRSTANVIETFSEYMLSYLCAYFISIDLNSIYELISHYFSWIEHFDKFYHTCSNVIFHYLKGLIFDLLFIFITISILLFLFNFEHPFILAIIMAFCNLFPYIGASLGQVLVITIDWIHVGSLRVELLILCILIQQIEANFVQPYIFKKVLNIKPVLTLFSFLFFGFLFGMIGFILAPVLAGVVQLGYRSYIYTKQKDSIGTWETMWQTFGENKQE